MTKRIIRPIITAWALLFATLVVAGDTDLLTVELGEILRPVAGSGWSIDNGVLAPARGEERTYIVTNARYSNVEITLEFNPDAGTNSGVFARCQNPDVITPDDCYEFNIWDAHPNQEWRTGSVVTHSSPTATVHTEDKWNAMRIRLDGARLQVWVNGTMTNDMENGKLAEGHIAFQYGGENAMVLFRNIRIHELP